MRHRPVAVLTIALALLAAASPTGARQSGRSFTIAAAGDILIHQAIAVAADGHAPGRGTYDFRPLLRPVEPWVADADLAICHLEGTLSPANTGLLYQHLDEHPAYFNGPREIAAALVATGWDACSTAGNHALDRGLTGIRETLEVLDAAGLGHAGTARDAVERLPALYRVNGVRVAHLAYTIGTNEPPPADARWSVNLINADALLADARWARENGAEFTIVSLHWGTEYEVAPDREQTRLAETLTDSPDVDLILGHHVHAVQPIARVNGKVVVYGLGDHLSNIQTAADGTKNGAEDGIIVHLAVEEREGGRFEVTTTAVTPTWVNPSTKQVLPVAHTLAYGEGAPAWALEASLARTTERVGRGGDVIAALSPQPWPSLVCEGQVATIVGTAGPDFLVGTPGDDVIVGREGNDTILGGGADDLVCSGEGDDTVWGGPGADTVHGGEGADLLSGGDGDDRLWGEAGDDRLGGGAGRDLLDGAAGGDVLSGHGDDDQLTGGSGADWLWGGTGADTLEGSSAADRLRGDLDDSCRVEGVVAPCR